MRNLTRLHLSKSKLVKPNDSFHAYHDFSWEHRKWFANHGINVNAPAFGRWVHKIDHDAWHKGAGGGGFNDYWKAFMEEEDALGASRKTVLDILAKLEECRLQFPLIITE